jgi:hypothetical protein
LMIIIWFHLVCFYLIILCPRYHLLVRWYWDGERTWWRHNFSQWRVVCAKIKDGKYTWGWHLQIWLWNVINSISMFSEVACHAEQCDSLIDLWIEYMKDRRK